MRSNRRITVLRFVAATVLLVLSGIFMFWYAQELIKPNSPAHSSTVHPTVIADGGDNYTISFTCGSSDPIQIRLQNVDFGKSKPMQTYSYGYCFTAIPLLTPGTGGTATIVAGDLVPLGIVYAEDQNISLDNTRLVFCGDLAGQGIALHTSNGWTASMVVYMLPMKGGGSMQVDASTAKSLLMGSGRPVTSIRALADTQGTVNGAPEFPDLASALAPK